MTSPRVSVICIFHNEEKYLAECVESVLAQDYADLELLLADDGSTDRSSEIARGYAARHPGKVFYLEHPGHANRGMSAARNLGLRHARGTYVAMVDGDDVWSPTKVSEQAAMLEANPDVGMVCGGYVDWRSWAGGCDESLLAGPVADGKTFPPTTTLKVYPLGRATNPTDPMIRREVVERVGGYEESFPGLYEDQAFLAKVYLETGVLWSTGVWLFYRRHPESCTTGLTKHDYIAARSRFLDWFSAYLATREVPRRRAIERAIAFARWELRHRIAFRLWKEARLRFLAIARVFGADTLYRQYRHGG